MAHIDYVQQTYENYPSTNTPMTAERLNHAEAGIKAACDKADELSDNLVSGGVTLKFKKLVDATQYDPDAHVNLMTVIHNFIASMVTTDFVIAIITYYGGTATVQIRKDTSDQAEYFVYGINAGCFKRSMVGGVWNAVQTIL